MSAIRIIHTADVHLDTSFTSSRLPSEKGRRKRQAIRESFRRVVDYARKKSADALVIAGDLYESRRVTPDTIAFVQGLFEELAPAPVIIAPGNHDPATPGSHWVLQDWPENVHVFREQEGGFIELPECPLAFIGYGFQDEHVIDDLVRALPLVDVGKPLVLVAHGCEQDRPTPQGVYAPMNPGDLAGRGLAYAALGHEHAFRRVGESDPIACYCGVPEARGFDETGEQCFLDVVIREERTTVKRIPSGSIRYDERGIDCTDFTTREEITAEIDRAASDDSICRATLTGRPEDSLDLDLVEITSASAEGFFHLVVRDETETPYDLDQLRAENTVRGRFVKAMHLGLGGAQSDEERRVAERALRLGLDALGGGMR